DYKTPIEELPKLLRWLDEGYDLVIGSRATSGAAIEVPQAWYRRLGSRAFAAWMHAIVGLRDIPDTQCGFKVFRADVARDLFRRQRIDGYIFDVEILYLARRQGYRIQQVGVRWRDDGDSRLDLITGNLQNFLDVLRIRLGPAQEGRPGEEMLASARPPSRFWRHPGDSGSGRKWPGLEKLVYDPPSEGWSGGVMRILVTGGAGFVGSNLVDRLLAEGHIVTAYDNFSTGQRAFLQDAIGRPAFQLVEGDVLDTDRLRTAVAGQTLVFHLAANADVRFGLEHPQKDLEQNAFGTSSVLEAMRAAGVRRIVFASTGSIYGEPEVFPTPEHCPFPDQTSLYGASKLAAEGLIMAYCHGLGFQAHIFRFVSLLGERYSHGHVFDFLRKLLHDPNEIEVLGNG